jgi:hypothetical protein
MKKYIVLSVNDNCDYLYFTPLTCWAWRQFGWEPIVFYNSKDIRGIYPDAIFKSLLEKTVFKDNKVYPVSMIDGYRSDTITQISRLYAGALELPMEDYLMTGDIDMIPLSDYWKPEQHDITVYGHDLTGYGHYPICYIGMPVYKWVRTMNIDSDYNELIKRDLDTLPQAKDPDFYKYWFSDQDLITQRLNEYGKEKITFVNRGQYPNGFAYGRVDRGNWHLDHKEFIDAHLMQQVHHKEEKIDTLMQLLRYNWPDEDFTWFETYTKEFKKLAV